MAAVSSIICCLVICASLLSRVFCNEVYDEMVTERSFTIDHDLNTFLMDGKPFRFVSGSFHYFRALPGVWKDRLKTMKAGGLNALDTYVDWSLHNPEDGVYHWDGIADLVKFLKLTQKIGFYVILRPGPYICAERDNGGIPYWLFGKYPDIKLRTSDNNYLQEVAIWYEQLMTRVEPFLYGNGGNIIMVQVENEYGDFPACDKRYLTWLRDETLKYVKDSAVLFTTDIPNESIHCGKINNVFATIDFGSKTTHKIGDLWQILRNVQPSGPLVNSEYYSGWLSHWQEPLQRVDAEKVARGLRTILNYHASVNIYMYFGGTNFGFTAGANKWENGYYTPDITSYDYDAVLTESGNCTEKFFLIRDVIEEFLTIPTPMENLTTIKSHNYGQVYLQPILNLLKGPDNEILTNRKINSSSIAFEPRTFEDLGQFSGFILYEAELPKFSIDPTLLTVNNLRDRAYVYIDNHLIGILSRSNNIYSLPLSRVFGKKLQILVENQGRVNYYDANDRKGILGKVTIQERNQTLTTITGWKHTGFPLENKYLELFQKNITKLLYSNNSKSKAFNDTLFNGPLVYYGEFNVNHKPMDTYLNPIGWGKGIAYINAFNLGRYWPLVGPQLTLYVPKEVLRKGTNTVILIELQNHNGGKTTNPFITLDDTPILDLKFSK